MPTHFTSQNSSENNTKQQKNYGKIGKIFLLDIIL